MNLYRSFMKWNKIFLLTAVCFPLLCKAQNAYFVDGFHGGIWGHYPVGYTNFITEQLQQNPDWSVNLEIEPETWDREALVAPEAYKKLQAYLNDSSRAARVEYVNPTYGQSYLFTISGESIIRQFHYGIKKLRTHFSNLSLNTYSSEEPCFTSALPQILRGFGFKYASLKNPNTCWGGYTRAYGNELVKWTGPDGSTVLASPRYAIESLKANSTWETTASVNGPDYVNAAFRSGIKNPVGMCLQDAGWRIGPWLKGGNYKPTVYTLWTNYFKNIADIKNAPAWRFSQEDVLTSLVWGSQVLQRLAQQVRAAENNVVEAEKIAVINKLSDATAYPTVRLDSAWRTLLLSQHHDCWIVPYNGKKGDTWADKVKSWTGHTKAICDSIINGTEKISGSGYVKIYNTSGTTRSEWVTYMITDASKRIKLTVADHQNKSVPMQLIDSGKTVMFKATVPAFGYAVYKVNNGGSVSTAKASGVSRLSNGNYLLENDLYKIIIDVKHGGTIKSLVAKIAGNKEFVDTTCGRYFNELRGNFYKKGGFMSSTQNPAQVTVLENGPYLIKVKIQGTIANNPFSQIMSLRAGEKRIGMELNIDWQANEKIGEFEETNFKPTNRRKAFYDDRFKLLTLFPLALKGQKVYKNAPFDVTESKLDNTFFNSWDSIKNNIIFNWVDVTSANQEYGLALYWDHVTSYTHGSNHPLGLTTAYSGIGLWGRDYSIAGPTNIKYWLLPHTGDWRQAQLEVENEKINQPLVIKPLRSKPVQMIRSYINLKTPGCMISSCVFDGKNVLLRIYNNGSSVKNGDMELNFPAINAVEVNLKGEEIANVRWTKQRNGGMTLTNNIAPFAFKTVKILLE